MFGLGFWELIIILVIIVIIFGASRLPQLGSGLGEGIRNFRNSLHGKSDKDRSLSERADNQGDNEK